MNIPNILTLSRLLFPVIVILIHLFKLDKVSEQTLICIFFLAFGLTDYLDGVIARKYNLISKFGKIFDPVSDKVLTASSLIYIISFEEKVLIPSLKFIFKCPLDIEAFQLAIANAGAANEAGLFPGPPPGAGSKLEAFILFSSKVFFKKTLLSLFKKSGQA